MTKAALHLVETEGHVAPAFAADYTYENWIEDLRGIVWHSFIKGRMTLDDIAAKANLHLSTVEKFAYRETKRPAARTTFELAKAVGFRLPHIPSDAPRQPDERDYREYRSHVRTRSK